jgi:hypothetical protein
LQKRKKMQTISITPDYNNGRLSFELPEELKNREIVIQIIVKEKQSGHVVMKSEQIDLVRAFAGIGKKSGLNLSKEDWYKQ